MRERCSSCDAFASPRGTSEVSTFVADDRAAPALGESACARAAVEAAMPCLGLGPARGCGARAAVAFPLGARCAPPGAPFSTSRAPPPPAGWGLMQSACSVCAPRSAPSALAPLGHCAW
eukprot:scaffold22390_cov28-Tisochrysis_lutea.AAC.1